jgi:phospholipase/lecithinase/hemolysin
MSSVHFQRAVTGAVLTVASLYAQAGVVAPPGFSALYVFGDSLSDSGNNAALLGTAPGQVITGNTYVPSQPYALGAYTNANTWVNSFAAGLGLAASAAPSLAGGGNHAYGGARTLLDGTDVPIAPGFPPSANTQLLGGPSVLPYMNGYLTPLASVPATALYVIAIGGNDVRDLSLSVALGGTSPAAIPALAGAYATAVGNMVDALQAKGAQNIIVWGTPNVGASPAALSGGPAFSGLATSISAAFTGAMAARVAGEAGVTFFDVFATTNAIVANPGAFGLSNVTDACGAVLGCNPSQYLFWDGIHPTSAGHALIASSMLAAVPEPSSMLMLAVGICGLLAWRRRA